MKPAQSVLEPLARMLLGLAAFTVACERTEPAAGVAVRDSGDVQWVEYGPGVPVGRIWIAAHRPADASERPWMIHDPDGRPLATIGLPTDMRPLDAGADYLLVYTRNDLDVERVLLYTIQPIEESA